MNHHDVIIKRMSIVKDRLISIVLCLLLGLILLAITLPLNSFAAEAEEPVKNINIKSLKGLPNVNNKIYAINEQESISILIKLKTNNNVSDVIGEYFKMETNKNDVYFELGINESNWYANIGNDIHIIGGDRFRILPNTEYCVSLVYDHESKSGRLIVNDTIYAYNSKFNSSTYNDDILFKQGNYTFSNARISITDIGVGEGYISTNTYTQWSGISISEGLELFEINETYLTNRDKYLERLSNKNEYYSELFDLYENRKNEELSRIMVGMEFEVTVSEIDVFDGTRKSYILKKGEQFRILETSVISKNILVEYSKGVRGSIAVDDILFGSRLISEFSLQTNYRGDVLSGIAIANIIENILYYIPIEEESQQLNGLILIGLAILIFIILSIIYAIVKKILRRKLSFGIKTPSNAIKNRGGYVAGIVYAGIIFSLIFNFYYEQIHDMPHNIEAQYFFNNITSHLNPLNFITISQYVMWATLFIALLLTIRSVVACVKWGMYCKPIDGIWLGFNFVYGLVKSVIVNLMIIGLMYFSQNNFVISTIQYFLQ